MKKFALAALLGAGAIIALAGPASARIACNREGECWHVANDYVFAPGAGIVVHEDNWHWGRRDHFHFREHPGHGYWRSGVWINL